jgi:hypothetical protein
MGKVGARQWQGRHTALVGDSPWVTMLSVKWKVPVSTSSPEGMQRRQSADKSESVSLQSMDSLDSAVRAVHCLTPSVACSVGRPEQSAASRSRACSSTILFSVGARNCSQLEASNSARYWRKEA